MNRFLRVARVLHQLTCILVCIASVVQAWNNMVNLSLKRSDSSSMRSAAGWINLACYFFACFVAAVAAAGTDYYALVRSSFRTSGLRVPPIAGFVCPATFLHCSSACKRQPPLLKSVALSRGSRSQSTLVRIPEIEAVRCELARGCCDIVADDSPYSYR